MTNIRVKIYESRDIVIARAKGRELAQRAGLGLADQTRLATAISEIVRNAIQYAGHGECVLRDESDERTMRIAVEVVDQGPGIPDLDLAMRDGYSTAKSLGAGLPGAQRITSDFAIESRPGHTRVRFCIQRPRLARTPSPTRGKRRW